MKRLLFALTFALLLAQAASAALIGSQDVRVLVPHWTNALNPMSATTAAGQWAWVRDLFWNHGSYRQWDLSATAVYPEYAVDPVLDTQGRPTCGWEYQRKTIDTALALGYDIPVSSLIVVVQNDCAHTYASGAYCRDARCTTWNRYVFGQKAQEMAYAYQGTVGITGGYALVCDQNGCVSQVRRDVYDNAANGDHHSYNATHRFQKGWLTYSHGDILDAPTTAGQYFLHSLDGPHDGTVKWLRLTTQGGFSSIYSVEVRTDGNVTPRPVVAVYSSGQLLDTCLLTSTSQFFVPIGATFVPSGETFGIRVDALTSLGIVGKNAPTDAVAQISIIEHAVNDVPCITTTAK